MLPLLHRRRPSMRSSIVVSGSGWAAEWGCYAKRRSP